MPSGRLLIVAPDRELRESLVFALEVEGFAVLASETLPDLSGPAGPCFDCAVLDQKAMAGLPDQCPAPGSLACPVVLLAADPRGWRGRCVSEVVDMPLIGDSVVASVRRVIVANPRGLPDC